MWVLLILMFVAIWSFFSDVPRSQQVPFSDFITDVRQDKVEWVKIKDREYRYQLKGDPAGRREERVTIGINSEEVNKELFAANRGIKVTVEKEDASPLWASALVTWLPMVFLLVMFYLFMRQMQAGGGKAMSFGKSKARMLSDSNNKITFADVAGIEEAKDDCEEIIAFLKDPKKFQRLGGRIPKGVLLMGSPGTGKTLLAKALAGEAGVPFFSISGSDFVEMFVGVGASRVRDLFEQGKKHAPCIIFIDEIDAVGRHRGAGLGGGHDEREQTLNQLLVEMDGFESNEGVIIIAATNRPDVLDPAILRPGRFDRRIVVPRPDIKGRVEILKVHTKKTPLAPDVDLEVIARGTPGFVGADLENLVNEAALLAARQDKESLSMNDFDMAKDKVLMGGERRSMVISELERRTTAWHEAGHALVAKLLAPNTDPVHKVTIVPRGPALGVTQQLPEEDRHTYSKEYAEARIAVLMGGRVAEEIVFGQLTTGAGNDIKQATNLARKMVTEWGMSPELGPLAYGENEENPFLGRELSSHHATYSGNTAKIIDDEIRRIVMTNYDKARSMLTDHKQELDRLAEALLDRETVDGFEIDAILEGKPLPRRERVNIPTYADKRDQREKRKPASIFGTPKPVPSGG
ncbi:MAG: ATP-dependent metallopeptidase FtsH/Yme1/Tma family protein [Deltaproteobacteria bacterium]|nr:ATP-dependent metallopeptidase FtsH/Yme1/Tma family protein [Deltaproteobacteria bacterium]